MKRMLRTKEKPKIEVKEEIKEKKYKYLVQRKKCSSGKKIFMIQKYSLRKVGPGADLGDDEVEGR